MNKIMQAADFAKRKHEGQFRKMPPDEPYINHPARVASNIILLPYCTESMVCAAWLHDTLEDTDTVYTDLTFNFGIIVANYVKGLTNPSQWPVKSNAYRWERKKKDLEWIVAQSNEVKVIKLADRLDNLSNLHLFDRKWQEKFGLETRQLVEQIGYVEPDFTNKIVRILDELNV